MKHILFTLFIICGLFLSAIAQVTPVTVTPTPVTAFQRSPEALASNGSRLFAIFESLDHVLHFSDDNGVTWTARTIATNGYITDVEVAGGSVYVLAQESYGSSGERLTVFRSVNNGLTFTSDYTVDITTQYYSNGKSQGYVDDSRLIAAGNAIFMVYDFFHLDMAGNLDQKLGRGYYKELNTTYWDHMNSNIDLNGPVRQIVEFNNQYVLVREPVTDNGTPTSLSLVSSTPDFLSHTDLPYDFANGYPKVIHDMGVADGKMVVIADGGEIYTRSNTSFSTKFTQQNLPFRVFSGGIINNNCYYLTENSIERAAASSPLTTQKVYDGPFNRGAKGIGPQTYPFLTVNGQLYFLGGLPIRSNDDGLTWSPWPLTNILSWSGKIITAGNQMFSDLGWGVRSDNGLDFSVWHPDGLDAKQPFNWTTMKEHKGQLFFADQPVIAYTGNSQFKQKILRGDAQGQQWTVVNSRDSVYLADFFTSKNRLFWFTRNWYTGVRIKEYSDDAGASWKPIPGTVPDNMREIAIDGDSLFVLTDQNFMYSYDFGQTWATTVVPSPTYSYHLFYNNGKLTLGNSYSGEILVSPDAGQSFYLAFNLPQTYDLGYAYTQVNDSLLIVKSKLNPITYAGKIGGTQWISFDVSNNWKFMLSFASFGGYLYGSQGEHQYYRDNTSTLSRIPLDQILDPLNNLPANGGWLSGKLFIDLNNNCLPDANEDKLDGKTVSVNPGNHVVTTNIDGSFGIALPPGNYQIAVDTPRYHTPVCFGASFDATVNPSQNIVKNIAFAPSTQAQDLAVQIVSNRLRPGMNVQLTIDVQNKGTQTVPAGVPLRFTFLDGPLSFVSANPAQSFTNPGELIFTLPAIPAYTGTTVKVVLSLVADPALTGQTFYFGTEAVNNFSDAFPADNKVTIPVIVTNSLDPNDKTVFSAAPYGAQVSHEQPLLKYLIRFQNTGSDTAFQVIVRDTLSPLLDVKTLKTLSASHPYRLVLRGDHIAEWHFNPIGLPDSTANEQASHGFVLFSIAANDNAPIGSRILNNAGIYFDFNGTVMTNTVKTKVVNRITYRDDHQPVTAVNMQLSPNPATDHAVLTIDSPTAGNYLFECFDATGRLIEQQAFSGNRLEIRRRELPAGAYHWQVKEEGVVMGSGVLIYK